MAYGDHWDPSEAGFGAQDWNGAVGSAPSPSSGSGGYAGTAGDDAPPWGGNEGGALSTPQFNFPRGGASVDAFGRPFDPREQAAYEAQHPDYYGSQGGYGGGQRAWNLNPIAGMNGAMGALGRLWNPLRDSLAGAQGAGGSGYHSGGGGGHFNYLQYLQGRGDLMHRYGDRVDTLGQNLVSRGLSNSTADVAPRLQLARQENADLMRYNQRMLGPYQAAFQASHDVPAMVDSYGGKLRSDLVARGLGSYRDPNLELGLMRTKMQGLGDAGIGYTGYVLPENRIPGYMDILQAPLGSA